VSIRFPSYSLTYLQEKTETIALVCYRYAYFKKLTYFSTECIYSPDGMPTIARLPAPAAAVLTQMTFTPSFISTGSLSGIANDPGSPAYRGHARVFLKDLEAIRPSAIIDIIHSGESFELGKEVKGGMKSMRESPKS